MYTLRVVNKNGVQNHSLGDFYSSANRFEHPQKFRDFFKMVFNKDHVADLDTESDVHTKTVIGFVQGNGDYIIPIYETDDNYIMTESGNTFERLNRAMTRRRVSEKETVS